MKGKQISIRIKQFLIIFGVFTLLISCGEYDTNEKSDEGIHKDHVFTSHEIGWRIKVPDDWLVLSKDRLAELDKKGLKAIENVVDDSIDYSELKHLISFSKDQFNLFQSTIEPFKLEYQGEWEENNTAIKELILTTYKNQGINAKSSEISIEVVGDHNFQKYEITIYNPKGDVILNQLIYSRLINGFDFGVSLNYNNEVDKNAMLEAWRNSHFSAVISSPEKSLQLDTKSEAAEL